MNKTTRQLAQRKQLLLAQSMLYRLRIRRDIRALPSWPRSGVALAAALPIRPLVLGLVLSAVPKTKLSRWLAIAAKALLLARLASAALRWSQAAPVDAGLVRERTDSGVARL